MEKLDSRWENNSKKDSFPCYVIAAMRATTGRTIIERAFS